MSRLGRRYGLFLIKQALEVTESTHYKHTPPGDEDVEQRISAIIDQNEFRDPMTDEVMGGAEKISNNQDFSGPATFDEGEEDRLPGEKPVVTKDSIDTSVDEAWREHDAFRSWKHTLVDSAANPGPAV